MVRSILEAMGRAQLVALALWVGACGGDDKQQRELNNDGEVCLRLQADGKIQVNVHFRECLSSCDTAKPTSCSVSGAEGSLVVTSHGAVERNGANPCSSACGALTAACTSSDGFAPGQYVVTHGADTAPITLGSQTGCLFSE